MRFRFTQSSLAQLREEMKKNGLRRGEREVTFAVRRTERQQSWRKAVDPERDPKCDPECDAVSSPSLAQRAYAAADAAFNFFLFELPSAYGMYPGRPLRILSVLIPLFTLSYWVALQTPTGSEGGIRLVWATDRTDKGAEASPVLLTNVDWPEGPGPRRVLSWRGVLGFAVYFSLLSAFHVGWRDFNIGMWLARIQRREYALRGTGWVRTVSGIQSLVSVYLIALWALTYFGRPFE